MNQELDWDYILIEEAMSKWLYVFLLMPVLLYSFTGVSSLPRVCIDVLLPYPAGSDSLSGLERNWSAIKDQEMVELLSDEDERERGKGEKKIEAHLKKIVAVWLGALAIYTFARDIVTMVRVSLPNISTFVSERTQSGNYGGSMPPTIPRSGSITAPALSGLSARGRTPIVLTVRGGGPKPPSDNLFNPRRDDLPRGGGGRGLTPAIYN